MENLVAQIVRFGEPLIGGGFALAAIIWTWFVASRQVAGERLRLLSAKDKRAIVIPLGLGVAVLLGTATEEVSWWISESTDVHDRIIKKQYEPAEEHIGVQTICPDVPKYPARELYGVLHEIPVSKEGKPLQGLVTSRTYFANNVVRSALFTCALASALHFFMALFLWCRIRLSKGRVDSGSIKLGASAAPSVPRTTTLTGAVTLAVPSIPAEARTIEVPVGNTPADPLRKSTSSDVTDATEQSDSSRSAVISHVKTFCACIVGSALLLMAYDGSESSYHRSVRFAVVRTLVLNRTLCDALVPRKAEPPKSIPGKEEQALPTSDGTVQQAKAALTPAASPSSTEGQR